MYAELLSSSHGLASSSSSRIRCCEGCSYSPVAPPSILPSPPSLSLFSSLLSLHFFSLLGFSFIAQWAAGREAFLGPAGTGHGRAGDRGYG